MSSFDSIAREGSGARLNSKQYREWLEKVRDYDALAKELAYANAEIAGYKEMVSSNLITVERLKVELERLRELIDEAIPFIRQRADEWSVQWCNDAESAGPPPKTDDRHCPACGVKLIDK